MSSVSRCSDADGAQAGDHVNGLEVLNTDEYPDNFYTHIRDVAAWMENTDSAGVGPRCRIKNIGRPSTEFEREFVAAMVRAAVRDAA